MQNKELAGFLRQQCKEKGLSLRSLSINSGLSPGTVYNIINRGYQPTLFLLNRLADYLSVKRGYLWQLAGMLEDMDYGPGIALGDPQLRFHFARVDKLPRAAKNLIISIIEAVIIYLEANEVEEIRQRIESLEQERLHTYVQIMRGFQEWKEFYREVIETFSKDASEILSDIRFESGVHFDREEFVNFGAEILHLRRVTTEQIEELADMLEEAIAEDSEEGVRESVTTYGSKVLEYRDYLKSRWTRGDFYGWAFKKYFSLATDIFFNDVAMEKLSIGQKGTVLLKLFLAEGDYPLIVDMPEENLDNKFIYNELVGAFRQAKTNRQLIVATNNANLVINTDAEQVIVAECKDNVIGYKVGTIEDRGIRDEITTILEGGKEALRKREQKYGI